MRRNRARLPRSRCSSRWRRRTAPVPMPDFGMRPCKADYPDNQRRIAQPALLLLDLGSLCVWIFSREHFCDNLAGTRPRVALEHDEPPWRQLAMVGHPRADRQDAVELSRGGPGRIHVARFDGAAGFEELEGISHGSLSGATRYKTRIAHETSGHEAVHVLVGQ